MTRIFSDETYFYSGLRPSAASDLIDFFDEGTWTPAITGTTNPTVTYTSRAGTYTRINDTVHFQGYILIATVSGGTGAARLSLPLTSISTQLQGASGHWLDVTTNYVPGSFLIGQSDAYGNMIVSGGLLQCTSLGAGDSLVYSGTYYI